MQIWWSKLGRFTRDLGEVLSGSTGQSGQNNGQRLNSGQSAGTWPRQGRSRGLVPCIGLVLLCLAVYVPGLFSIPPIDRDESRFAQASRQMHESGDYIVPRVQDRPRLNKPPLIYWLQCASVMIFGDPPAGELTTRVRAHADLGNIWVFRIPSVLCAISAVLVTFRVGSRMFDARSAWLGAACLAICPMVAWDAHQARADQLLLLCTTATMACLFLVWRRSQRVSVQRAGASQNSRTSSRRLRHATLWPALGFWMALGAGVLAKGPITPLIATLTIATLCLTTGRWRWLWSLRPVLGGAIVLAMVAPWVAAVGIRVGWGVYLSTILKETIGRSGEAAEGHWGPPGYHLVLLVVLMWPISLMTGLAIRRAWSRSRLGLPWKRGLHARVRITPDLFLLAWALPAWVLFELVSTKLPHYPMPLYPALCLLSARTALASAARATRPHTLLGLLDRGTRLGFAVWGFFALVLSLPTFLRIWWALRRRQYTHAIVLACFGLSITMSVLFEFVLPGVLAGSARINEARRDLDHSDLDARPFAAVGYHEDSLVFLTRGGLARLNPEELSAWIAARPNALVAIAERSDLPPELQWATVPPGLQVVEWGGGGGGSGEVLGVLNYSKGHRVDVRFFEPAPPRSPSNPEPTP